MTTQKSTIIWELRSRYGGDDSYFTTKKDAIAAQQYLPNNTLHKLTLGYDMTTKQLVCAILNGAGYVWQDETK
jgi:hypothetical protein